VVFLFYAFSVLNGFINSVVSLIIEDVFYENYSFTELLRFVIVFFFEVSFFRYLTVWWRTQGIFKEMAGAKHVWGDMTRRKI